MMRRAQGFSLLEVLLAVTILSIMITSIYGVVSSTLISSNRASNASDLYATGRELVTKIADDVEGALPPQPGSDVALLGTKGDGSRPTDSLSFYMTVRRVNSAAQKFGGRALVEYGLDPLADQPGVFALRRHEEFIASGGGAAGAGGGGAGAGAGGGFGADDPNSAGLGGAPIASARYLSDQVAGLRFAYADPMNGEIVDSWDTTGGSPGGGLANQPRGLPGAVKIFLYLYDEQGAAHEFATTVDLPLANIMPTPGPQSGPPQGQGQ